jgi:hypothetical protein
MRTAHSDLTVEGGLRHLLQLHALTQLVLPHVPIDSVDYLRSLTAAAGRRSLHIERTVPRSFRSHFEQRWMEDSARSQPAQ